MVAVAAAAAFVVAAADFIDADYIDAAAATAAAAGGKLMCFVVMVVVFCCCGGCSCLAISCPSARTGRNQKDRIPGSTKLQKGHVSKSYTPATTTTKTKESPMPMTNHHGFQFACPKHVRELSEHCACFQT